MRLTCMTPFACQKVNGWAVDSTKRQDRTNNSFVTTLLFSFFCNFVAHKNIFYFMAELQIKQVSSHKELMDFVRFHNLLYKDCPQAVPVFDDDVLRDFNTQKNAAFEFCEAAYFLALRDGKVVGRVAAIINKRANEKWGTRRVRFGWIDFVDDMEVSQALIFAVEKWGRQRGMDEIVGPLGFSDMDQEGMLFDGYDRDGSMYTIYDFPYYNDHMRTMGFEPEAVWVERVIDIPQADGIHAANQQKFFRVAKLVQERYGFQVRKFKSKRELRNSGYIIKIFEIINASYTNLYGYSTMTERQMQQYAAQYLPFINLDLISVVENQEGTPIAVGICMPNLRKAIQSTKGRLFPLGWWRILKALYFKHSHILDLLLIGTLPEYQDTGCISLIFADIIPKAQRMGFTVAECCPQLETNNKALSVWRSLDSEIIKRRQAWKKSMA